MNCPVCREVQLVMTHRENIEIDYCPQCRGVWLDRGELDKIIERSAPQNSTSPSHVRTQNAPAAPEVRNAPQPGYGQPGYRPAPRQEPYRDDDHRKRNHDDDRRDYRTKKKKRGGSLDDLFDFD